MRVNRVPLMAVLLSLVSFAGAEEVVHLSRLQADRGELTIQRDLFHPGKAAVSTPVPSPRVSPPPPATKTEAQDPEARMRRSIVYEGYIRRGGRLTAIISVDGEYFVVARGEPVVGTVSVADLDEKHVVVMVDDKRLDIPFQGVGEHED